MTKNSLDPTSKQDIMSGVTEAAVIPFPKRWQDVPTRDSLAEHVRTIALGDSRRVFMTCSAFKEALEQLDVGTRSAFEVLRTGKCTHPPYKDQYGDWRVVMRRKVAGRRIFIEVAVRADCLICIAAS